MLRPVVSWRILPLLVFSGLIALLYMGLWHDPQLLPSVLIGHTAPPLTGTLLESRKHINTVKSQHGVWLLNVWATWCDACRSEHPVLMEIARQGINVVGLAYKDDAQAVTSYLQARGDPFTRLMLDSDGQVGEQWGVYGAPETFVIDQQGIVRYKHIGGLTGYAWQQEIAPLIRQLEQ